MLTHADSLLQTLYDDVERSWHSLRLTLCIPCFAPRSNISASCRSYLSSKTVQVYAWEDFDIFMNDSLR